MAIVTPHHRTLPQAAARLALASAALALACLAILHFVQPELDPARRMISEYAIGPHGWLMTVCFAAYALASAGLALAVVGTKSGARTWAVWLGVVFLVAAAAGPALAAVFPTDPPTTAPEAMTQSGRLHGLSFMIGVPGDLLAMVFLAPFLLRHAPSRGGSMLISLTVVAWISVIVLGSAMVAIIGHGWRDPGMVGVANRVFIVAYGLWVALAGSYIARDNGRLRDGNAARDG